MSEDTRYSMLNKSAVILPVITLLLMVIAVFTRDPAVVWNCAFFSIVTTFVLVIRVIYNRAESILGFFTILIWTCVSIGWLIPYLVK